MVDETIELGSSGVQVSRLGMSARGLIALGCSEREATVAVRHALDGGVTLFDVADVDGFGLGEELLSRALGINRFHVTVATKFGIAWDESGRTWREISPARVRIALEASLRRLRLESIPLYYIQGFDGNALLADVLGELERCREQGKIRASGLTAFEDADLLSARGSAAIDALQIPHSLSNASDYDAVASLAKQIGASLIACESIDAAASIAAVQGIARRMDHSPAQVALRWTLQSPGVGAVLFEASRPAEVDECLGATDWRLDTADYHMLTQFVSQADRQRQPLPLAA